MNQNVNHLLQGTFFRLIAVYLFGNKFDNYDCEKSILFHFSIYRVIIGSHVAQRVYGHIFFISNKKVP